MKKRLDIIALAVFLVLATCASIAFSTNKFIATTLFFGLPVLYLIIRKPVIFKKSFIFAFLFSIPLSFFVDTLAVYDGAWYVPYSIIPFRLFGAATLEVYWFGLLWTLLTVTFYEYFFGQAKPSQFPKRYRKLLYLFAILVIAVVVAYTVSPSFLIIPYFYLWVSIIFVIPMPIWFLIKNPLFTRRFFFEGTYFFCLLLLFEIVALYLGLWTFPGHHFIGWIYLIGYKMPLEEFIFWMIFATPSMLAYYLHFAVESK